jgi:2'-5' RNA ligase superfamily
VPWEEPGSTAIVVLTPEAEPVAGRFYRAHTDAGRDGMTPHVTLLVPFVPADGIDEALSDRPDRSFGRFEAFDYGLARFEYFESGVLYLAPEPSRPFVDLVLGWWRSSRTTRLMKESTRTSSRTPRLLRPTTPS